MSDNSKCLPCPLCLHIGVFDCVQTLRNRLIYVSTCNLVCPICQEEICGLDKLTIHLFTHVKLLPENTKKDDIKPSELSEKDIQKNSNNTTIQNKKPRSSTSKNKSLPLNNSSRMKFVKIYPKLPVISVSSMPFLEFSSGTQSVSGKECVNNNTELTVPALKIEKIATQTNTTCNVCGIQFIDENILKMHKCLIHNIDDNKNHDFTRYQCHLCSKNFKMRGSLMVHLRVAHYGYNSGSNSLATPCQITKEKKQDALSEDNKLVLERHDGKQWQCDDCRKCFTTKYFLKKHKRLHTGETPYSCAQCNKSFTFQQSYHKHLLYHNDEKPHICNFCGRAFKELSTLHNHQRIHTGEKPFSCETCGKCFRQRVSYLVHRRIHTGVMPYKCTACDKNFRYKVSQRTHRCQVQPPGTVVRQNGDLVEKLKKKNINKDSARSDIEGKSQTQNYSLNYNNISEANAELVRAGAKLSLEDTETENYNIIAGAFSNNELNDNIFIENSVFENVESHISNKQFESINTNIEHVNESINFAPIDEKVTLSPSEILKGLCLSQKEDKFYSCENYEK